MGAPAIAVGGLVGIGASYMGYQNTVDALKQQSQMAMVSARLQQQQFQMQSAMQAQQAAALMGQSGAMSRQADAYMQQADIAAKTGQILQANEMRKASQAQREAEEQSRRAAELRRQFIGEGKVKFAANGVLLEGRPQSAVAMWEQDETADLAVELTGIKRKVDEEVYGYAFTGTQHRMQGLFDAQALKLQSDASRIEAGTARINAAGALAQSRISMINAQSAILQGRATVANNNASADAALWNFIGSVGGIGMSAGTMFAGMGSRNASGGSGVTYPGVSGYPSTYGRSAHPLMANR